MDSKNYEFIIEYLEFLKLKGKIKIETIDCYKKEIEDFVDFISPESVLDVTNFRFIKYIETLEKKYSLGGIRRKIAAINGLYKYYLKKGIITIDPIEGVKVVNNQVKENNYIKQIEINKLLESCDKDPRGERDKLLIMLLSTSGFKINDLLKIRLRDILNYKEINIIKKNGILIISLDEIQRDILKRFINESNPLIEEEKNEFLFKELSRQNFRARFKRCCKNAGIDEEISPNEIKELAIEEKKALEESVEEKKKRKRAEYFKIGIGDD